MRRTELQETDKWSARGCCIGVDSPSVDVDFDRIVSALSGGRRRAYNIQEESIASRSDDKSAKYQGSLRIFGRFPKPHFIVERYSYYGP